MPGPRSTSSQLRWPRSPTPAPAPATVDSDRRWVDGLDAAEAWFLGDNDGRHVMWDPDTGGGFDGLTPDGPNLNQGTESTLALLSTLQHARRLVIGTALNPAVTSRVQRSPQRLGADPSRVVTMLFVPGQEGFDRQEPRTSAVVARILALDNDEVEQSLDDIAARFDHRHRDLSGTFRRHADELAERLDPRCELSETRRLLLGATFTNEYAIEGAALCNPSMVAHPDQTGVPAGSLRFVMSVRAIGEGHRSSIEFRTGLVDGQAKVDFDGRTKVRDQRND